MNEWQIGGVKVTRIVEMELAGGNQFILPDATPELCLSIEWLQPHFVDAEGQLIMSIHALIVDTGSRRLIVDTCVERYGRIDCLVNSAHVTVAKPLTELTEADFRATWDSHVIGHFACTRRAAIHMTERGGSIVNLVSRAMAGLKGYSAYSAAKGAILSATFSWALELAPHGIRVNAISPAARHREPGEPVNLRMPWRRQPGQSVDEMRAETPPPESVAPLVVYLASDASDWVSGQIIFLAAREAYADWAERPDVAGKTKVFRLGPAATEV